ncbi:MAG TPA: hypothetical protein VIJ01_00155 [Candidatus Angelobacter sp.]
MRITRIAVFAGKLASSIWIDLPGEGHPRRITAREQTTIFQRDVIDIVAFRNCFALSRQLGNADKGSLGFGAWKERAHVIRVLFAKPEEYATCRPNAIESQNGI